MKFRYEAFDAGGKAFRGSVDAPSTEECTRELRHRGLFVATLHQQGEDEDAPHGSTSGRKRNPKQVAAFTRQLYVLIRSGTSIVDALGSLERQMRHPVWQRVVKDVRERVEEGGSLAEALEQHPECFDPIYRNMIAAGEASGRVPVMLDRLARLANQQGRIRSSVIGALVYPAVLLVLGSAVTVLMLLFVMPRFSELFETLDAPLPPSTAMLLSLSDLLRQYWWGFIGGLVGLIVGGRYWLRSPQGRRGVDTLALRAPQIGKITRDLATARITRLLGILLESQLPMQEALRLLRESIGNCHYRALMRRAEEAVTNGEPISTALSDPTLITSTAYEAIRSGESGGGLGGLLLNIADLADEDNEAKLKTLSSVVEPAILTLLGLLVGSLAVSMFLPLFDLATTAGGG